MAGKKTGTVLREELQQRAEAEREALQHVCVLAEKQSFEEEELQHVLDKLMIGHYTDAVEERSIAKVCGYPCCSNPINKGNSKQKFHISLERQKIYDMEELQMFCSLFCYKASNYVKSQLPIEPIWMRHPQSTKIEFLHKEDRVDSRKLRSEHEIDFQKLDELQIDVDDNEEDESSAVATSDTVVVGEPEEKTCSNQRKTTGGVSLRSRLIPSSRAKEQKDVQEKIVVDIGRIRRVLTEWSLASSECKASSTADRVAAHESDYQEKAALFFAKSPEWLFESAPGKQQDEKTEEIHSEHEPQRPVSIPPSEKRSQQTIRRRIVRERLHKSLDKLLDNYNIPMAEVWTPFNRQLLLFQFANDNITLKPAEWTIVALLLLQRLANSGIDSIVLSDATTERILRGFGMSKEDLSVLAGVVPEDTAKTPVQTELAIGKVPLDIQVKGKVPLD